MRQMFLSVDGDVNPAAVIRTVLWEEEQLTTNGRILTAGISEQ